MGYCTQVMIQHHISEDYTENEQGETVHTLHSLLEEKIKTAYDYQCGGIFSVNPKFNTGLIGVNIKKRFSNADNIELLKLIASVPWEYPESVQLFIQGEDDERWTVFDSFA